jgi:hypothetical protein
MYSNGKGHSYPHSGTCHGVWRKFRYGSSSMQVSIVIAEQLLSTLEAGHPLIPIAGEPLLLKFAVRSPHSTARPRFGQPGRAMLVPDFQIKPSTRSWQVYTGTYRIAQILAHPKCIEPTHM